MTRSQAWNDFQDRAAAVEEALALDPSDESVGWTECETCHRMNIPIVDNGAPEFCPDCDPDLEDD